jgi:hypothetical protein
MGGALADYTQIMLELFPSPGRAADDGRSEWVIALSMCLQVRGFRMR